MCCFITIQYTKKESLVVIASYYLPVYHQYNGTSRIQIFFCSTYKCHDETPNQERKKKITVNIHSYNLKGSNMYDL